MSGENECGKKRGGRKGACLLGVRLNEFYLRGPLRFDMTSERVSRDEEGTPKKERPTTCRCACDFELEGRNWIELTARKDFLRPTLDIFNNLRVDGVAQPLKTWLHAAQCGPLVLLTPAKPSIGRSRHRRTMTMLLLEP